MVSDFPRHERTDDDAGVTVDDLAGFDQTFASTTRRSERPETSHGP